jgi:hypothetical protein
MKDQLEEKIDKANTEAVRRLNSSEPVLVDIAPAREVIPGLGDRMILHSGPPITWSRMCGAQRGAVVGLVLFEGWAKSADEAVSLLQSGAVALEPNHHHDAVGSMAGATSPSLPVWVVENRAEGAGNRAYCGHVDSRHTFGEYSEDVLNDLYEWRDVFAPSLREGLKSVGALPLKAMIARSLQMGDGLHSRCVAASSLLANALAGPMIKADVEKQRLLRTLDFVSNHRLNFLSLSMASAKSMVDWASDIEYSTIVVTMARNGVEFGIRVSGLGDEWFTAPAPTAFMRSFVPLGTGVQPWEKNFGLVPIASAADADIPRWTSEFAGLDMGDSAITETVGWGATTLANQLGFLPIVGCTLARALEITQEVRQLSFSSSTNYAIPVLNFEGSPLGIDLRKVVGTGILPVIDTGIAHKEPNHSIVGSGLARPPMECFKKAYERFQQKYGSQGG